MINENNKSTYDYNIHLKDKSLNSISRDTNLKVQNIQNITLNSIYLSKHLNKGFSKIDLLNSLNEKKENVIKLKKNFKKRLLIKI
jgi:hypothetical protein